MFVIGGSKVRPRIGLVDVEIPGSAARKSWGIYMQFYNFEADEKTHKPDGTIDYEIVKVGAKPRIRCRRCSNFSEAVKDLQGGASQVVIENLLPLADLDPGQYKLTIKVTDKLRSPNQTLTQSATFTVN